MEIEFIYTFEDGPQKFKTYPFVLPILENKKTLIDFATAEINSLQSIVKISCCVYGAKDIVLPDWYNECNGKIWAEDLYETDAEQN